MKNLTLFVTIILFSSCVTSQLLGPTDNEELQLSYHTHTPFSAILKHSPNRQLNKCFSNYKKVTRCFIKAFTRKPTLLNKNCKDTVFGSFRNPFVSYYVREHCSSQNGSTPGAPSPA
ncbi:hypothetical protein EUTSA_v10015886mg [Eutrema salsugineum]|uniref:Prolamin-like domain-containing protein n=1 Tax=Eutrema salsugineum TaxID=72664 RepID=V4LH25_EUTSA|nr:hypothetical protein EUTSA_v10015886mg [Eutrema salsugineum]